MTPRERYGLWGVLAGAFLLRLLLVLSLRDKPFYDVPIVDSAAYDAWAVRIAEGDFFGDRVFYQDPLYPYGLGTFYAVFGRDLTAARIAQCVLGTFGLWMLFEAVRRLLGYRTAIVALVIGALYKAFLFSDATLLKDFLGVMAVEAALLFWSLESKWKWAAFGAALGAGTLVRGNMLLLVPAAAALLLARRQWKPALLVAAGAAACILPVTARNAIVAGDLVLTTAQLGPNLFTGNNPGNTTGRYRPPSFLEAGSPEYEEAGFRAEAERLEGRPLRASEVDAHFRRRALGYIGSNFGTFLGVTGKRALMLLSGFEVPDDYSMNFMARFSWVLRLPLPTFGLFVLPLAAAGIYLAWAERKKFAMAYVLLAAYFVSILFIFVFGRYRLPAVPILILFAAHAIVKTAQMVGWRMRQVPKTAAAVFVAAAVAVNLPLPTALAGHRDFRAEHYNLGLHYLKTGGGGRAADVAREFEAAARLDPDYLTHPNFVWMLAEALEKAGREEDAFEQFERAVRMDLVSPDPPYRVGQIYLRRGMYDRASRRLAQAVARDRGYAAAYVPLAEARRRLRDFEGAFAALEVGAAAAPKDWSIPLKRAEICRELSMWKEALQAAERALEIHPGQPDALKLRDEVRGRVR